MDDRDDFMDQIALFWAAGGIMPTPVSTVDAPESPPDPDPPPAARATDPSHLRSAEGCIHRDSGVGCCPVTKCELSGRKVTILDCLRCILDRDLDVHSVFLDVDPWG